MPIPKQIAPTRKRQLDEAATRAANEFAKRGPEAVSGAIVGEAGVMQDARELLRDIVSEDVAPWGGLGYVERHYARGAFWYELRKINEQ